MRNNKIFFCKSLILYKKYTKTVKLKYNLAFSKVKKFIYVLKTYQMENDPRSRHFFYEADLRFEIVNGLSGLFKNIQNFPTKIIRIIKHEL